MATLRPPPLNHQTAHVTQDGKPTKEFFNWLKKAASSMLTADSTDTLTNKTLADTTDVLGGVTMTLGSDATGDIYYRNASGVLTRLPIGAATNVLTVAGSPALPSWAAASPSGLTYLGTVSVSGGALADTTILAANNSAYRSFELIFKKIVPGTNAVALELQVHSGGAFQTASYEFGVSGVDAGAAWGSGSSSNANILLTRATVANAAPGYSGFAIVSDLADTTAKKIWFGQGGYHSSTPSFVTGQWSGDWNGGNGAIDGFQIIASTGTLTSGSVDIYGIL